MTEFKPRGGSVHRIPTDDERPSVRLVTITAMTGMTFVH